MTIGGALHLPMPATAWVMEYWIAGMPMDVGMLPGMALNAGETGLAACSRATQIAHRSFYLQGTHVTDN